MESKTASMKKAFDLLTEIGLSYEFHDYKKQGIVTGND